VYNAAERKKGLRRHRVGDEIAGHLAQRKIKKVRKSRFPHERDTSHLAQSRIQLKQVHKVRRPTEIRKIYRGLRNSLFNVSAILKNSMFELRDIMSWSAVNLFR